jgi:hypothetical protein
MPGLAPGMTFLALANTKLFGAKAIATSRAARVPEGAAWIVSRRLGAGF